MVSNITSTSNIHDTVNINEGVKHLLEQAFANKVQNKISGQELLAFTRSNPAFSRLRPSILAILLSNPDLLNLIKTNPELISFLKLNPKALGVIIKSPLLFEAFKRNPFLFFEIVSNPKSILQTKNSTTEVLQKEKLDQLPISPTRVEKPKQFKSQEKIKSSISKETTKLKPDSTSLNKKTNSLQATILKTPAIHNKVTGLQIRQPYSLSPAVIAQAKSIAENSHAFLTLLTSMAYSANNVRSQRIREKENDYESAPSTIHESEQEYGVGEINEADPVSEITI